MPEPQPEFTKLMSTSRLVTGYPAILVVGDTGEGKTFSIRNLPPEQTLIFNIELKPLPFKNWINFKYIFNPRDCVLTPALINNALIKFGREPIIKYVIIDSFARYWEILLDYCYVINANKKDGYAVWNDFNDGVTLFMEIVKKIENKFVILFARPELLEIVTPTGAKLSRQRCAIQGKLQEKKTVESNFSYVFFTSVKKSGDKIDHKFIAHSDGYNTAKTPEGIFENIVDNDLKVICDKIEVGMKLTKI